MKRSILFLLCMLFFAVFTSPVNAESLTEAKKTDIKKLLDMTGALDVGQQMSRAIVSQMTNALKSARPDIPENIYDIIAEEVNKIIEEALVQEGGFVDMMLPVYHAYYSHADIKGLIAFYQTELGRKLITTMPALTRDSMAIGQMWGQSLGPVIDKRVRDRLQENGIDIST